MFRGARGLGALALLPLAGCAAAPSLVDADPQSGFALYRSGRLSAAGLGELCAAGVEEIVVLEGGAGRRECRWREDRCPGGLRVRYDARQRADEPLDAGFLDAFDAWVEEARVRGRKVAFRCRHGWHRTGRLAAYYRLRFQGWGPERAKREMLEVGRFMGRHPYLKPQVDALGDRAAGRPCSTDPQHCVAKPSAGGAAPARFEADACASPPVGEASR